MKPGLGDGGGGRGEGGGLLFGQSTPPPRAEPATHQSDQNRTPHVGGGASRNREDNRGTQGCRPGQLRLVQPTPRGLPNSRAGVEMESHHEAKGVAALLGGGHARMPRLSPCTRFFATLEH